MFILNDEQKYNLDIIKNWYENKLPEWKRNYINLDGYAGTGKTTLVKEIINEIGLKPYQVVFCSFTGNAVVNLIKKGNDNSFTVHKLIYDFFTTIDKIYLVKKDGCKPKEFKIHQAVKFNPNSLQWVALGYDYTVISEYLNKEINSENIRDNAEYIGKETHFHKKLKEHLSPLLKLIILDEYSMIDNNLLNDLLSFNIKIICLGDKGQLPPVSGNYNFIINSTRNSPTKILTKIERQKGEKNQIIEKSFDIRNLKAIPYGVYGDNKEMMVLPEIKFKDNEDLRYNLYNKVDCIIVGKNATKNKINNFIREKKGYTNKLPEVGEKIICLVNNYEILSTHSEKFGVLPLVNGTIGIVDSIKNDEADKCFYCTFHLVDDMSCKFENIKIDYYNFDPNIKMRPSIRNTNKSEKSDFYNEFSFAYAITCHKSQGSQFNNILVIAERMYIDKNNEISYEEFQSKWLYTAVTRAIKKCILVYNDKYYDGYAMKAIEKSNIYYKNVDKYYPIEEDDFC